MTRAHWILLALFLLLLSLVMPKGCASKVFKWVDEQGITHYSDKKPADAAQQRVSELPVKTPPPEDTRREVTLRNTGSKRHPELRVRNPFHGPVNIRLKLTQAKNIVTEPPLPDGVLDTVVPARYDGVVLYISPDNPRQGWGWGYEFTWEMGDPAAVHAPDEPYRLPFKIDGSALVGQAFNGETTHNNPQNRYAVDIGLPIGTPVLAARGGVVMDIENQFADGQAQAKYIQRNNYVRLLHDDGTMAVYAHLKRGSLRVRPGQRVQRGQRLGSSGNSGYSTGPHLHFVVQKNDHGTLKSIPFEFADSTGQPFTPKKGQWLRSQ